VPLKTASGTSRLTGFCRETFLQVTMAQGEKHHAQTHGTACEGPPTAAIGRSEQPGAGGCRRGRLLNGFGGLNAVARGVEYGSCVSKNRIGFAKYAKDCIR